MLRITFPDVTGRVPSGSLRQQGDAHLYVRDKPAMKKKNNNKNNNNNNNNNNNKTQEEDKVDRGRSGMFKISRVLSSEYPTTLSPHFTVLVACQDRT